MGNKKTARKFVSPFATVEAARTSVRFATKQEAVDAGNQGLGAVYAATTLDDLVCECGHGDQDTDELIVAELECRNLSLKEAIDACYPVDP